MEPNALNKIIKKKSGPEKEKILLDELINQIEAEQLVKAEDSPPLEINDQVKAKMAQIMDAYLSNKEKLAKITAIRRELSIQSNTLMKELQTLMKLYGLTELIKGSNKFVLDRTVKKRALKKKEFKEVITYIIGDPDKVEKIYSTADHVAEGVAVEKIKCLKYKDKD